MPGQQLIDSGAIFAPLSQFRRIGLAVSGGPDSLALLLLAHRFATETGDPQRFIVYSVDHALRPEAAAEAAYVLEAARSLGFEARGLRWDGPKPATGISAAARTARYSLIAAAMAADGAEILVTAHHLADQAETVLMRLAHGSGLEGLRGMDYFSEIHGLIVVRPLLGIDPADLAALVTASGLVAATDPSNADTDYERVRWRQMLPQLAALGLDARRLARFADRMRDADVALAEMAERLPVDHDPLTGTRTMAHDTLLQAPRAVAVRGIAAMLSAVGGGQKSRDLGPIEALTDRLRAAPALKRTSLHGCLIQSNGSAIVVAREPGRRTAQQSRRGPEAPVTGN